MPRIPRNLILEEGFQTHKMWRGHNKEWNLSSLAEKSFYLRSLNKLLPKQSNVLNAYTLMSNHSHENYDIKNKNEFYNIMRNHHSRYGMFFNKKHNREGRVAYDRPKTCLVESDEYSMKTIFYIHANPVKAGITKNAASYKWSTHRLYAFGKRDEFNKHVKFPKWYMDLGNTSEIRQKVYRRLFDAYLKERGLIKQDFLKKNFFGSYFWVNAKMESIKYQVKEKTKDPP